MELQREQGILDAEHIVNVASATATVATEDSHTLLSWIISRVMFPKEASATYGRLLESH